MTEIIITKSKNKDKKYDARIDGKKTVSFGAAGMSDFTKHKDTVTILHPQNNETSIRKRHCITSKGGAANRKPPK